MSFSRDDNQRPEVTVCINAHREGRLVHHSLKAAEDAAEVARQAGITVEIIAVVDNPDDDTRAYIERHRDRFASVHYTKFGDIAMARNHGSEVARGQYLAFMDGDDLFSLNWLKEATLAARKRKGELFIYHPEGCLNWGRDLHIYWQVPSSSNQFDGLDMLQENYWTSMCLAPIEVWRKIPYGASVIGSGFGHEDWHWNCETLAAGIPHFLIPETLRFGRLKTKDSVCLSHMERRAMIRPTKLFDRAHIREMLAIRKSRVAHPVPIQDQHLEPAPAPSGAATHLLYRAARKVYRVAIKPFLKKPQKVSEAAHEFRQKFEEKHGYDPAGQVRMPQWAIDEWRRMNHVDPTLLPHRDLPILKEHLMPRTRIAEIYGEILDEWPEGATHLFVVPWFKRGGADWLVLHLINTMVQEGLCGKAMCIMTMDDNDSPWVSKLPSSVSVYNLGHKGRDLSDEDKEILLTRLILQEQPKVVHNINSAICYNAFIKYGKAISQISKLYTSSFCVDYLPDGTELGFPVERLNPCFDFLEGVFVDNAWLVDHLAGIFDMDRSKFHVNYTPAQGEARPPVQSQRKRSNRSAMNLLWASRLDVQKRPDILLKVAKKVSELPVTFHVYGDSIWSTDSDTLNGLSAQPNVKMYGGFDGFRSLPLEEMDAFLYTAEWDGIPVVLLDAVLAGLPCIAPKLGGIPELLGDGRGFLVQHSEDVDGYIEAIRKLWENPDAGNAIVLAAQDYVARVHVQSQFVDNLRQMPGYSCQGSVPVLSQ